MKWDFTLLDKMSGPADDIAKSVSAASVAMKNAAPAGAALASAVTTTAAALEKATEAHEKLVPAVAKSSKALGLTIAQHHAVAQGLAGMGAAIAQSSLSLEQHTAVAKALSGAFSSLATMASKSEKNILQGKIATVQSALEVPRLRKQLESLNKELNPDKPKKFTLEMGNLFRSFAGLRQNDKGQFTFNVAEGLSAVFDGVVSSVERLVSAFRDITGKALEVAAAGEKTKRAFNLDLGATGGKELLSYLDQVRNKSRGLYTQEQLTGLTAPLAQHGIGLPDIKRFLPAALSVEARGGNAGAALGALGDVRTNRSIGTGTLEALNLGSFADKKAIAGQLGKQFGFGGSYAQRNPEAILSAISERLQYQPQKADQVVRTLLAALAKREGGALGNEAAGNQSGTAATFTRLQNLPQNILEKLTSSGQLDGLVQSLEQFVDVLTGPKGKGFIDGFAVIIDKFANLIVKVSHYLGDEEELKASKPRALSNITASQKYELASRALHDPNFTQESAPRYGINAEGVDTLAAKQLRQDAIANKGAGAGTVLTPAVKDIGDSFATSFFDKWTSLSTTGAGITPSKSADDFIWRNGTAIEIDPHDTVVGYKRGGSLGVGDGGGSGGGMSYHVHPGAIQINGTGMDPAALADEVVNRLEKAPGRLLLSALDQFAAESGAA